MTGGLPTKILRVEELTFILPDTFDGNIIDAFEEMVVYMKANNQNEVVLEDEHSTTKSLLLSENTNHRLCMKFGIFSKNVDDCYERNTNIDIKFNN